MDTHVNISAPEALISPPAQQLAKEINEIETKPESAKGTASNAVAVDGLSSDQLAIEKTIDHILDLASQVRTSKEAYAKKKLEMGHGLWVLQNLYAKPGHGSFLEKLKALRSTIRMSKTSAYVLIREFEVSTGLKPPPPPPPSTLIPERLSGSRKDESSPRENSVTVVANDPTMGIALERSEPIIEAVDTDTLVPLQILASDLEKWDAAVATLRGRPGYESADLSELVTEAVTAYADIVRLHHVQAQEDAEENTRTARPSPAFVTVAPAPIPENAIKPVPVPMAIAPPTPRPPLTFSSGDEEVM